MGCVDVVIETPKGSSQKYDYDPETHFFKMKKILPSGMVFPYDFGFVPDTKGEDGDPLDVIVISEFHSFPGCMIKCRIIGGIKAEQSGEKGKKKMIRNDRYLAIPKCSNIFEKIKDIEKVTDLDLSSNQLKSITAHAFARAPNLVTINLSGNPLELVDPAAFTHLENLTSINLCDTKLSPEIIKKLRDALPLIVTITTTKGISCTIL